MKTMNDLFRHNEEMPVEAWEELRRGFIRPLKAALVGRRLLPVRRLPRGTQTFSYDRIKAEESGATIIAKGGEYPYDEYTTERVSVDIPKFGKGFQIPLEDWEAGIVQNEKIAQARRFMQEKEDALIFSGDADYNILGLLDYAGDDHPVAGGKEWDLAATGIDLIYDDVRSALLLLRAQNVLGPYTMVVNPTDASSLERFDTTSRYTARRLVDTIIQQVLISDGMTADTAMVMRTGSDIAELGVVEDINLIRPRFDDDRDMFKGKVRARLIPIVYQYGSTAGKTDAIVTISNTKS